MINDHAIQLIHITLVSRPQGFSIETLMDSNSLCLGLIQDLLLR
jgi:hypothetical protein